LNPQIS